MAGSNGADGRHFQMGRVFGQASGAIGSNPLAFLIIGLVFGAMPTVAFTSLNAMLTSRQLQPGPNPNLLAESMLTLGLSLASLIVLVAVFAVVQGSLIKVTLAHDEGRQTGLGDVVGTALRAALPLAMLGIIMGVAETIGLVFFIVPGVILAMMWAVAAPALVAERRGIFGALGRSRALTKGLRWQILGLTLIILLIRWFFSALGLALVAIVGGGDAIFSFAANGFPWWYLAISVVTQTIDLVIVAALQTSLYVELLRVKEGPGTSNLAEIFA